MPANTTDVEKALWEAADELRANSRLKSSEYSLPVLGLIFLRYADYKFTLAQADLAANQARPSRRRSIGKADYHAQGVLFVPDTARFANLLSLPEGADIARALSAAMQAIEQENPELSEVLPRDYRRLGKETLVSLLKILNSIPMDIEGDAFGKIYEYFLGKFAMSEGQKGGEFFTPTVLVKLIVEVIAPYHGRIFDPACGSGGMFVQSANFVTRHQKSPTSEISVFGQERVTETVRLCRMNLAVHGLAGDIREGNSYYENLHASVGRFDFVMANPPFNVDKIDKEKLKDDTPRFPFGMPRVDNAKVINVRNIGFGYIKDEKLEFILPETVNRLSSHLLEPGDIVFGRKGAVERHAFIQSKYIGWFQGSDCLRLRFRSPSVDAKFVSYNFLTESHKQWMINQCSHGSTMASLNQEIVSRIPLHLPPHPAQNRCHPQCLR